MLYLQQLINLLLIVAILVKPELRSRPSNWLILNLAFCMLIEALVFVGSTVQSNDLGVPHYQSVPGLCEFVTFVYLIIAYAVPISIILVTVEKFASIVKSEGKESGFGKGATIGSMIGTYIFLAIIVAIDLFGVGMGFDYYTDMFGQRVCYAFHDGIGMIAFTVLQCLLAVAVISLTSCVAIWWCRSSTPEVREEALPVVIANIFYLALDIPYLIVTILLNFSHVLEYHGYHVSYATWYIRAVYGILVPILWLVCSKKFRKSYRQTCCPCCPGEEDEEKTLLLEPK